ncbi:hypothetical protein GuangZ0019_1046 [Mycobacterium tuberculosis GuangZ0019]|nr:hypothetical protein GuangZ0019_1046 [Mycobacterium tuberculosis GuangZ0019]EQM23575.1 hypothetical protein FJ05194_0818 [Mycobacterium tuberculosis FJ05194]KAF3419148.1 integrase catalytic region domain protein [Mycobacterium tuberculosis variant bovis BCG]
METFDQPLGFGITGLQIHTLAARVPRKAWHAAVSSGWRAHHRPTAPSPSHTNTLGTAPNVERCCHHPAYKSSAVRVGINSAEAHREYPHTMVSTGNAVAVRTWPYPTGTTTSGNQKSHCPISPATYVARRRIRRQIQRPQLAYSPAERPDRIPPTDPLGDHRRRHPRIGCQQLPDPRLGLICNRALRRTLVLRRPIGGQRRLHRVPRNLQHPRDLRNRQPLRPAQPPDLGPILHAQHSLPPWPIAKALQEAGQFSVAALWSVFSCRRHTTRDTSLITAKIISVILLVQLIEPVAFCIGFEHPPTIRNCMSVRTQWPIDCCMRCTATL